MGKLNIIDEIREYEGGLTPIREAYLAELGWYDLLVQRDNARLFGGVA